MSLAFNYLLRVLEHVVLHFHTFWQVRMLCKNETFLKLWYQTCEYSGFSIIHILVVLCQETPNTGWISDLVRISELPFNLIVLPNRGHDR